METHRLALCLAMVGAGASTAAAQSDADGTNDREKPNAIADTTGDDDPSRWRLPKVKTRTAQSNVGPRTEPVSIIPMDKVLFVEVGWRIGLGDPPSRVPEPFVPDGEDDSRSQLERIGTAVDVRTGGIYKNVYGSLGYTRYAAGRASPSAYDLRVGFGAAGRYWFEGRPVKVTNTSSAVVDASGNECQSVSESDFRDGIRGNCYGQKTYTKVTTSTNYVDVPPGWSYFWVGAYGGWRGVSDFLGGSDPSDETSPLNSGGGPIIGMSALMRGSYWAVEFGNEFVYHVHGWDDHGKLGYGGYFGIGAAYALMDLRWRLDPGVGKSFMFGIRARLDLF